MHAMIVFSILMTWFTQFQFDLVGSDLMAFLAFSWHFEVEYEIWENDGCMHLFWGFKKGISWLKVRINGIDSLIL